MSSSHERERQAFLPPPAPEVPRRLVRVSNQTVGNGHAPHHHGSHPAIREIHKNAWLKRLTANEKKGTPFVKKCEKFWVVFCVHDDVEAFLEFYTEPKMGATHKPVSAVSLNACLHVSPSIIGQDNEYQFAVTLQSQVIRLMAANWDQMIEWVESLQGKLREMNILSPKDNLYSKLPETRSQSNCTNYPFSVPLSAYGAGLVSTRDPNSPLPPTPNGYISPVLGTETSRLPTASVRGGGGDDLGGVYIDPSVVEIQQQSSSTSTPTNRGRNTTENSNTSTNSNADICRRSVELVTITGPTLEPVSSSGVYVQSLLNCSSSRDASCSGSDSGSGGSLDSSRIIVPLPALRHTVSARVPSLTPPPVPAHSTVTSSPGIQIGSNNTTVVTVGSSDESSNRQLMSSLSSFASGSTSTSASYSACSAFSFDSPSQSMDSLSNSNSNSTSSPIPTFCQTQTQPGVCRSSFSNNINGSFSNCTRPQVKSISVNTNPFENANCKQMISTNVLVPSPAILIPSTTSTTAQMNKTGVVCFERQHSAPSQIQRSSSSENIYEHLFVPESSASLQCRSKTSASTHPVTNSIPANGSISCSNKTSNSPPDESTPPVIPRRNPQAKRLHKGNTSGNSPRSSSLSRLEEPSTSSSSGSSGESRVTGSNGPTAVPVNGHHNQRHRTPRQDVIRSFGNSSFFESPSQFPVLQGRPLEGQISVRSGEYRIRRDDSHVAAGIQVGHNTSDDDHSSGFHSQSQSPQPPVTHSQVNCPTHVPLKEQQVMRLRAEINHPGGVRVVLRKKDCVNSIAFVDFLGAVWIAGWKQQQHPVLYYAFHVGDQILKVAGVTVQTSVEANRAIKMVSSMQVEFIIRRLPFGRVFVLKRTKEGEPLGLVSEGNSGEIGEVVSNGLAANHGLSPKGPATDGHSSSNWFLTEINNRPLSLMARESEVKERLNAVGKEISILVQPADLVKPLKKGLKSLKGFKDYVVV